MPRIRTDAAERTAQNHKLVTQVATDLGVDNVTIKQAQEYRRRARGVADIVDRKLDLADPLVQPVGVVFGAVGEFRNRGAAATLALTTNSREFGDVLLEASQMSESEILVMALYVIPRNLGLEPELDPDADDTDDWAD